MAVSNYNVKFSFPTDETSLSGKCLVIVCWDYDGGFYDCIVFNPTWKGAVIGTSLSYGISVSGFDITSGICTINCTSNFAYDNVGTIKASIVSV